MKKIYGYLIIFLIYLPKKLVLKTKMKKLDLIIDTVAAPHDFSPYLNCLKIGGTHVLVGVAPEPNQIAAYALVLGIVFQFVFKYKHERADRSAAEIPPNAQQF